MSKWLAALAGLSVLAGCADAAPVTTAPVTTAPETTAPETTGPATTAPAGVRPQGVELVAARVTAADGAVCDLCVWLADTGAERARGLMGVTDLSPASAMAFAYPRPTTTGFWMKDTLLPLSIAFFDADGRFLDSFDMAPCTADPCRSYATAPGFTVAVEVPQGDLDELLMLPGSTLTLLDLPCTGDTPAAPG